MSRFKNTGTAGWRPWMQRRNWSAFCEIALRRRRLSDTGTGLGMASIA